MANVKFTQLEEILIGTDYFKQLLDRILSIAQPAQYCPNLIIKLLLHGPDGSGKRLLSKCAAKHLGMHFNEEYVCDLFDENIIGTEKKVKTSLAKVTTLRPCIVYMSGYQLFRQLEDIDLDRIASCISDTLNEMDNNQPIVFIAGTNDVKKVVRSDLTQIFHYDIAINPATNDQAKDILNQLDSSLSLTYNHFLNLPSDKEYYLGNLIDHLAKSKGEDYDHLIPVINTTEFSHDKTGQDTRNGIGWDDIGGLANIKKEIIDAFKMLLDYPELKKTGLKRTGILLYGPPGTGKTLLAKAVATECNLKFISVKGPELLNEYVGQSEDNVRKVFERARKASPAVIFFDELDSLVPNRGQAGDSGGVMDRIVSQVCAEMDGVGNTGEVFVMGATNRVDLVDPSLLRPGRFDKILEVPLPKTSEDRLQILKALTRKISLSRDVDLNVVESTMPSDMSGADIRRLCSVALEKAFERAVSQVESGNSNEDDVVIEISMKDFGLC